MAKKLYAARVIIRYEGVGTSPEAALKDAWNTINNDVMFQQAQVREKQIDLEETNFDPDYLKEISKED